MKVLVVENEQKTRESIIELIKLFCEGVRQIEEAEGIASTLKKLKEYSPDVVLLDVELSDGTAMELLQKVSEVNFQVIFITSHNKYAVDAFKFSALDFLLKPISPDDLISAFNKAKTAIHNKHLLAQVEVFKNYLLPSPLHGDKIVLKDSQSIYFVKINDILFCEAEGSYTTFNLINNEQIVISKKIKEFEEPLEQKGFIRVHQSYLVNKFKIKKFSRNDGGILILENDQNIPVAQRKRDYVLSVLTNK